MLLGSSHRDRRKGQGVPQSAIATITAELIGIGYRSEAVLRDYEFADVMAQDGRPRRVDLAAFTHTPESYRTAAFGAVLSSNGHLTEEGIATYRALGAPLLFT